MKREKYDIFVSHASADKLRYVDGLVEEIKKAGLSVFYDTECIGWGDSIYEKIYDGLDNCTLAVVVISKNFFDRKWPERELKELLSRQDREKRKIVMPILYNVNKKQLLEHYPELEDIYFKYSRSSSCKDLAQKLKQEIEKMIKDNQ